MEIKKGDIFRGKINNCIVEVIKVEGNAITYQDLKTRRIFTCGKGVFEHARIYKENPEEDEK